MTKSGGVLPDLIIAGVVKAGTTSLYRYLNHHKGFVGSRRKETCYFLPVRYGCSMAPVSEYKAMFPEAGGVVFEATPGYFHGGKLLAEEVKKVVPSAKVCVVLRDPVDRFFSFYSYQRAQLNIGDISCRDYIAMCLGMGEGDFVNQENDVYFGLGGGMYAKCLESWVRVFGKENLLILDFDELSKNPSVVVDKICAFVGLEGLPDSYVYSVENKTRVTRFSWLQHSALRFNKKFELFFRRNPGLKEFLRGIYFSINREVRRADNDESVVDELVKLYAADVVETKRVLELNNLEAPSWLERYI